MVERDLLTPGEAAALLGVWGVMVRLWARAGKLPARTTPGGHRRFEREEIESFARRHGMKPRGLSSGPMRVLVVENDPQFATFLSEALLTL